MARTKVAAEAVDAGAFLSQVTHHLRAPVAAARTMLSLLSQGYVGPMDDRQADLVRRVETRLESLQALVDDLVDLASLRTGASVAGGPTPLDGVAREVCSRFEAAARAKGIVLGLECPPNPVMVPVEPGPLELVATHLVGNALAYTDRGSVQVSVEARPGVARLAVADSGIGIPAADRSRVFEEFFRAANAKEREQPGTGLGLTIVRDIVCRAGAAIEIESEVGRGTTIAVVLPLATASAKSTVRRKPRAKEARNRWPRS